MKSLIKIFVVKSVIALVFLNSPLLAKANEVRIDQNNSLALRFISKKNFRTEQNFVVNEMTLIPAGTIGNVSGDRVRISDIYGNTHVFYVPNLEDKKSARIGEDGPKIAPLVGAAAATAVAVPAAAFLVVLECSAGSGSGCGKSALIPFIPAGLLVAKSFDSDDKIKGQRAIAKHESPLVVNIP